MEEERVALKLSRTNYEFAKKLYAILSRKDGNIFFSPISLYTILSLLSHGSANKTLKAFNDVLEITPEDAKKDYEILMNCLKSNEHFKLYMANNIYINDLFKFKEAFSTVAKDNYRSNVESVNFSNAETANLINGWVKEKTNHKIKEIVKKDDLDNDTRILLLNAVYFNADWIKIFKESSTTKDQFHRNSSESVEVDMMHQRQRYRYGDSEELNSQIIELPYVDREACMYIILPKEIDGINALKDKFQAFDIFQFREKMYSAEVILALPKFKIEITMKLNNSLTEVSILIIIIIEKKILLFTYLDGTRYNL